MASCIRCRCDMGGKEGITICAGCAGELTDKANPDELLALAKVGIDALVDETTRYQQVRPFNDLRERSLIYRRIQKRLKAEGE